MKKLLFNVKLLLTSLIIYILQLLVWLVFEFLDYNQTEFGFFLFVTTNFLTFYICFGLFQKWLGVRKFFQLLLMASVQTGVSIFIIFSGETAKIRAIDILFYVLFIICYFIILNKLNRSRAGLIILIVSFTLTCFFFYQKLALYTISLIFQEKAFSNTSNLHDDFYFMNQDSTEVTYPFRQKNKIYFIEFWNSHCGACIKKLPEMKRLIEFYKSDTNVRIISLYCPGVNTETRTWFYEDYSINSKNIPKLNYQYTSVNSMEKYKITIFPHFYLIDKNGNGIEGSHINFNINYPNSIYEKIEALKQN